MVNDPRINYIYENKSLKWNNRAQITVFIILALIIISLIILFFIFRSNLFNIGIPAELDSVYDYYISCIENEVSNGVIILGQQGGYIDGPDFSPGSQYMPFSSHLGFMGFGIPYWYYISGNGVKKEQMPTLEKIESELENYVKDGLIFCDFSEFEEKGFEIELDNNEVKVDIKIEKNKIEVNIGQRINIKFGKTSWTGSTHSKNVKSGLWEFYGLAKNIYDSNKKEMFLEDYGVDILRLNAPVDGTEIGCSTKLWSVDGIRIGLMDALEVNIPAIKIKGDYYNLKSKENQYFVRDIGKNVDASTNINFMYSKSWPMKMEVWPSQGDILRADPIGTQEGLEMMGFCYVPYHFVYDFAFPVLIQLYSGDEFFQFPVVVSIDKNKPREALDVEGLPNVVPQLCEYKNSNIEVYTYNTNLEPVEAKIKFKCFDTSCDIGETKFDGTDAFLSDKFPQCVNGYIVASADGYKTKKHIFSTVNDGVADIVLEKEYELNLEIDAKEGDRAIITFKIENGSPLTISYPEQKKIKLTEGQYEIVVYVYSEIDITLDSKSSYKCVSVPKNGIFGIFGFTEEKCFDLNIPSQKIDSAISGGGTQSYYITESELSNSNKILISVENFGKPSKLEDLQLNYNNALTSGLNIGFE